MTRARQRLLLTGATRRRLYGVEQSHTPSLFLADVPHDCIHDYSAQPVLAMFRQPWQTAPPPLATPAVTRPLVAPVAAGRQLYAVGSQVMHEHFGRGVVQRREGEGEELKLTVIFRDHGSKKILAKFAPMQPL
jgi:DNA helicase-2/ATP-dependent DNA helicase PcrA